MAGAGARLFVVSLSCLGMVACGGHSGGATPFAGAEQVAALTVHVRLPASTTGTLAVSVYADGKAEPNAPTTSVQLDASACALDGAERLCTAVADGPVGLVDVAVRASGGALSGHAFRQLLPPAGESVALAFDGTPARWAFSPSLLAAPADGSAHTVPFAIAAQDARGFTLLRNAPQPPSAVTISGDRLHQLTASAQGAGEFALRYGGLAAGDVTVSAAAPGAAAASTSFGSLAVNPASLEIAPGSTIALGASLPGYAGAFTASAGSTRCSVSPASATPAGPGATVQFNVRLASGSGCEVLVRAVKLNVPIVIPVKNAVAHPGLGIGGSKIKHVVVLFQENRSFDNLFGGLDGNGKPFPGADTVSNPVAGEPTPHNHLGQPVTMSIGELEACYSPLHYHGNALEDIDGGKMDGFDVEGVQQEDCAPSPAPTNYVYQTLEYGEVKPYWLMGEKYAISDRMYEPITSASYGTHLYLVSGQSSNTIDNPDAMPWGCDGSAGTLVTLQVDSNDGEAGGVFPCFTAPTLADEMDARGVSWRFYAPAKGKDFGYSWLSYDSYNDIRYGPDWSKNIVNPPAQIITDVGNGTLESMTWVVPMNVDSDHAQAHSNLGPAWITSVVNAIGTSSFWDSTAIFVTWDDWGGWYDHVPPPVTGVASLGMRVPVIVISPYARNGYVSHVQHDTGSILHFTEEVLDLPSLGEEDSRQDDFMDAFNFAQTPTPFAPFAEVRSKGEVMRSASVSHDDFSKRTVEDEQLGD